METFCDEASLDDASLARRPDQRHYPDERHPIGNSNGGALRSETTAEWQAEEKTLQLIRILRTMAGGNRALIRARTEDELFQKMCRVIVATGGYRMAWVGQVEHDEEKSIRPLAHAGHEAGYLALAKLSWGDTPHGRGPSGMSVRTGATQLNNDVTVNPAMGPWKEAALERRYLSSISLPLRDKAGIFGALTIYAGEPNAFGPDEVALLEDLADDVSYGATALRTRRDHDEMEQTLRLVEERRQVEEALQKSEQRYRMLVEQAVDGIFLSDAAGHYVDVNSAGCKMLGYTRDEILARAIADVVAPEEVSRIEPEVGKFAEGRVTRSEWRFRRKDGSELVGEVVGRQLPDGFLLAILRDVTERSQAEEALRASEERLKLALDAAQAGFWESRLDTGEFVASDQALALYGLPSGTKLTHELALAATCPEDHPRVLAAIDNALRIGAPYDLELRSRHPDGSIHWLHSRAELRSDKGMRLIGLIQDITARKEAEEALAAAKAEAEDANRAKSKFLAAASHDLRQPVQSLTLLLDMIQAQIATKPKTAKSVDMAKSAVDSLNNLLTGILDISKLDAGAVSPEFASVDAGELVERLAREYQSRAAALGLTLRCVANGLRVRSDAALLERIVRNLIENALRYTEKGGVLVGVRRRGERVRLDVIDTGIGIPADMQSQIFEEFRQLNNPARDASRGLGLGLAIVSRLAKLLGTNVQVASRLGRGTRFSVLLPITGEAPADIDAVPAADKHGGRILVIEDNPVLLEIYHMMLKSWGYEPLCVTSGENAIDLAARERGRFDAILADHRLGSGLSGSAAANEIARREARSIPTLIVTGDTAKDRIGEIAASGFSMLHKPVSGEDLRRTLAALLTGAL